PSGGAQQHGSARPRSAGPTAFRAAEHCRDRASAEHQGSSGRQTLYSGFETAEGDPAKHAGRHEGVPAMSNASSEHDPVNQLAEEFLERYRRGERPSVTDYAQQHPQWAEKILDVFPALLVVEECAAVGGQSTGPHTNATMDDRVIPRQLGEYHLLREV